MPHSLTHKYIPRVEQREPNLFIEEYYSSTDVTIYIDDIEQTEISYINYMLQEQLKPLYGYASRTFDDVAVGNRIVTGTLKVPIKNPDVQTKLHEILQAQENANNPSKDDSTQDSMDDYNQSEEDLKNAVGWIDDTLQHIQDANIQDGSKPPYLEESEEDFNYRSKLIELGYDLTYGSSQKVLEQQIVQFQKDHGISPEDGKFNADTKSKIDELIAEKWEQYDAITLPAGTQVYVSPTTKADGIVLTKLAFATVRSRSISGWIQIRMDNGQLGWVQTNTEEE